MVAAEVPEVSADCRVLEGRCRAAAPTNRTREAMRAAGAAPVGQGRACGSAAVRWRPRRVESETKAPAETCHERDEGTMTVVSLGAETNPSQLV